MEKSRAKFNQIYANLPDGSRSEIVAVINNEPYTWRSAKVEVDNSTETGDQILNFLIEAKILV